MAASDSVRILKISEAEGNMVNDKSIYDRLWQQLHEISDTEDTLEYLQNLKELSESQKLSPKERYDLQIGAFNILKDLTLEQPEIGQKIILENLLPHCLIYEPTLAYELSQHRECLVDWLNQYKKDKRYKIREHAT